MKQGVKEKKTSQPANFFLYLNRKKEGRENEIITKSSHSLLN